MISIHAARVGCDRITPQGTVFCADFNPRSPSGLRLPRSSIGLKTKLFQSTQPEWAATRRWRTAGIGSRHFNPRSPSGLRPAFGNQRSGDTFKFQSTQPEWAATWHLGTARLPERKISIHAARVGCDQLRKKYLGGENNISIHAARVGCDL